MPEHWKIVQKFKTRKEIWLTDRSVRSIAPPKIGYNRGVVEASPDSLVVRLYSKGSQKPYIIDHLRGWESEVQAKAEVQALVSTLSRGKLPGDFTYLASVDSMAEKLASEFIETPLQRSASRMRTAGEVRFIKDNSSGGREFLEGHTFKKGDYTTLTKLLWQVSVALGHTSSVVDTFSRLKSFNISPDGKLGGTGYNKTVADMRMDMASALNTLSSVQDTLYDEVNAPHWRNIKESLPKKQRDQVDEIIGDVNDIKEDPEGYAEEEFIEEVVDEAR